jgi:hypothetical protein
MENEHDVLFAAIVAEAEFVRLLTNHPGQVEIRRHGSYWQRGHESSTWYQSGIKTVILSALLPARQGASWQGNCSSSVCGHRFSIQDVAATLG